MTSTNHNDAGVPCQGARHTATGRNPGGRGQGAEWSTAAAGQTKSEGHRLMEQVVERSNMRRAYERVVKNRGAPGVELRFPTGTKRARCGGQGQGIRPGRKGLGG